jgi:phage gp36-like protein
MATTPPYTDTTRVRALITRNPGIDPGTAGSVDEGQIELAIRTAASTIDSKLSNLYTVPFNPIPGLIIDIATAIAAWSADLTYREVRDYSSDLNPVLLRYKWAMDLLAELQSGKATLPDYQAPDPDPGPGDNPNDPGSIVDVINPCPSWPVGWSARPMSYDEWNHW